MAISGPITAAVAALPTTIALNQGGELAETKTAYDALKALVADANAKSASDLTTGTLSPDRVADGSLTLAKLAVDVATQAELDAVAASVGTANQSASNLTSGTLPVARIADGSITEAKLAFAVATQAELDAAVLAAGGAATTSASALTSGTLDPARIANGALPLTKLAVDIATQAELDAEKTRIDTATANAAAAVTAATTPPTLPVKTISGSYTFILADTDSLLKSTSATAVTYTIPLNSSVAFAVGRSIRGYQGAAGAITFAGAVGVTVNALGGFKTTGGQFAQWEAFKVGTNEWLVSGEMA